MKAYDSYVASANPDFPGQTAPLLKLSMEQRKRYYHFQNGDVGFFAIDAVRILT